MRFAREEYAALSLERVACACCGSTDHLLAFEGDRHDLGLQTVVCRRCGLIFTNPRPADAWFAEFYKRHYRHFYESVAQPDERYLRRDWIAGRHARNLEMLSPVLGPTGRVLDVGAAEGTFLHLFSKALPAWQIDGLEPSEEFSAFARSHYGLHPVKTGALSDLRVHYADRSFDLVTAGHVLEHLLEPNAFLRTARDLLNPDGLLFVDVPDVEAGRPGIWNIHIAHVYHFSRRSIGNLLAKHGFALVASRKGLERPDPWTFQVIARKAASAPPDWHPAPVDAKRLARRFRHHATRRHRDRLRDTTRAIARRIRRILRLTP